MRDKRFEKLLEPYHIGSVKTRNRIIKSAAGLQYWIPGDNPVTTTSAQGDGALQNHLPR